jgi:hypothetical protein
MSVNSRGMPPWRSRSKSLIESAPAIMPAISASTFAVAFAPPLAAIRSPSVSNVTSPQRVANASPPHDTRFGSSNRAPIARRA